MFWNNKKKQEELRESMRLEEERLKAEAEEKKRKEEQLRKERREREDAYLRELERKKSNEMVTLVDDTLLHCWLDCLGGMYEGVEFPLEPDDFVMIGRNPSKANIVIPDETVSGFHCQVRYSVDDGCYQVVDFSSFGTFVNGDRLVKNELTNCPVGSVVQLAESENRFCLQSGKRLP